MPELKQPDIVKLAEFLWDNLDLSLLEANVLLIYFRILYLTNAIKDIFRGWGGGEVLSIPKIRE